jgi:predicted amidohydrolase
VGQGTRRGRGIGALCATTGAAMRVAACQLPHVGKDIHRALSLIEAYTADAERQGAALVCFPECFLQGYVATAEHIAETALDLGSAEFTRVLRRVDRLTPIIVVGLIEREADRYFNAAAVIQCGVLVTRYRKAHLLKSEATIFDAGSEHPVFDACGVKVAINICNDLNHAESVEAVARAGAELLVCPSNNLLPPGAAEQWKARHNEIRRRRAQEAGMWLVSSDVTGAADGRISYGPTAIIDPLGRIVEQVPLMTTGTVVAEIG